MVPDPRRRCQTDRRGGGRAGVPGQSGLPGDCPSSWKRPYSHRISEVRAATPGRSQPEDIWYVNTYHRLSEVVANVPNRRRSESYRHRNQGIPTHLRPPRRRVPRTVPSDLTGFSNASAAKRSGQPAGGPPYRAFSISSRAPGFSMDDMSPRSSPV